MALARIDGIDSRSASSFHTSKTWHTDFDRASASIRSHTPRATMTQGVTMTTFTPHRDTVEAFVDTMHGGADKDALSAILAEDVVLYSPLGDEPVTGREAVLEAMQVVGTVAADLTYKEVLSGETHHAGHFRLQIEDPRAHGRAYIPPEAA